ncbi:sft2-domain-containing protein [Ceraceosorus bombacis]|uniref:Protein transport protein SFT2 n=1 Tax=Ceraceosorus bombacis TaxID=401625 RepID=A0A0P1BI06_9BASI|nr:sft2-domain-containing protein [Ceraceosorus bombacis]
MPSWLPGSGSNPPPSTQPSTLGGGSGNWMNMDNMRYAQGELTGENDAFKGLGLELTRQQRIMGFVGCLVGGFALSIVGSVMLFIGAIALFAILYSIGVIVSLVGTGFLVGFKRQLKAMFEPVRIVATLILFAAFVMVWVAAFAIGINALALIFVVILYLAYIWYSCVLAWLSSFSSPFALHP